MIKRFALAAAAASLFVTAAEAKVPEAERFVGELVTELREAAEAEGEQSPAVRAALQESLATEAIGRFLLAGEAADGASEMQMERYNALFPRYIAAAFAEEIGQLTARRIEIEDSLERRPGDIIVQSELYDSKGAKRADIDWRVRVIDDGSYRLLDVLVERISPLITRRQTFSSRVRDEGMDGLLRHMEEVIASGAVAAGESE